MKLVRAVLLVAVLSTLAAAQAAPQAYLYRASLVQAAPGRLVELIDLYKAKAPRDGQNPLWMRHSQGDRWDLLILLPVGTYADYYRPERIAARREAGDAAFDARRKPLVAWEEDVFVWGPPLDDLRKAFAGAGFFHVEMFHALPGRQAELLKEREMENAYARAIHQPDNFVFVRDQGAAWDVFTVGCFRDLKHYAASADVPRDAAEAAAKAAGFESAAAIGPYLRQFIADHHDTLAVAIR